MREQLIAYLLDDLSEEERSTIEARVRQDPRWEQELAELKTCFDACSEEPSADNSPPQDLTSRTCCLVQNSPTSAQRGDHPYGNHWSHKSEDDTQIFSSRGDISHTKRKNWSFIDLAIASSVLATLGMLFLPALHQGREASRIRTCKNNQQHVGRILIQYAHANKQKLPAVGLHENAGIFALKLIQSGLVSRPNLGERLVCPGSPMAQKRFTATEPCVPTVEQLALAQKMAKARPHKLLVILRNMAGSYAYPLGHFDNGVYRNVPFTERNDSPMLIDAPAWQTNGSYQMIHGGSGPTRGANLLAQDLSVKFILANRAVRQQDDFFLNHDLQKAAGRGPQDIVMGSSEVRPDGLTFFP